MQLTHFNPNTNPVIIRFVCPNCEHIIEEDITDIVPSANLASETIEGSENSDSREIICSECEVKFYVMAFRNNCEGSVAVRATTLAGGDIWDVDDVVVLNNECSEQ